MTHDELLAKIDDSTNGLKHEDIFPLLITNTQALRAVVRVHKPRNTGDACVHCSKTGIWIAYPCPTIQVIEKELQ